VDFGVGSCMNLPWGVAQSGASVAISGGGSLSTLFLAEDSRYSTFLKRGPHLVDSGVGSCMNPPWGVAISAGLWGQAGGRSAHMWILGLAVETKFESWSVTMGTIAGWAGSPVNLLLACCFGVTWAYSRLSSARMFKM
jgi:hypothetical protein